MPRSQKRAEHHAPMPVVWVGLMILIALLPLPFGGNRPWAWSLMALWCSVLLGAWALTIYRRPKLGIRWLPSLLVPAILFAIVIAWALIQALLPVSDGFAHPLWAMTGAALGSPATGRVSVTPTAMPSSLIRLLSYAIIFWLTLQLCTTTTRTRTLLVTIGGSAAVYAVYGLVIYSSGNSHVLWYPKWAYPADLTATFVNRNSWATYAGIGMLTCAALAVDTFRRKWRLGDRSAPPSARFTDALVGAALAWTLLAVTVAAAWLQSHSRMGFASGALGCATFYFLLRTAGVVRHGLWLPISTALGLLIALGLTGEVTFARIFATSEIDRLPLFRTVLEAISDAPWLGSGYGSFPSVFVLYRDLSVSRQHVFTEAHNTYLELALELGLPVAAGLIGAAAALAGLCATAVYRLSSNRIYPALAFSVALVAAVHSTLDFSLQIPAVAGVVAALLGGGIAQATSARAPASSRAEVRT